MFRREEARYIPNGPGSTSDMAHPTRTGDLDTVGASPPNSCLLQDRPAIDVENAWGLDATAYGNHELDHGVDRVLAHQDLADFPFSPPVVGRYPSSVGRGIRLLSVTARLG